MPASPAVPQSPVNSLESAREYLQWIASAAPRLSIAGVFDVIDAINLLGVEVSILSAPISAPIGPALDRYAVTLMRWKEGLAHDAFGKPSTYPYHATISLLTGSDLPVLMCQAAGATLQEVGR